MACKNKQTNKHPNTIITIHQCILCRRLEKKNTFAILLRYIDTNTEIYCAYYAIKYKKNVHQPYTQEYKTDYCCIIWMYTFTTWGDKNHSAREPKADPSAVPWECAIDGHILRTNLFAREWAELEAEAAGLVCSWWEMTDRMMCPSDCLTCSISMLHNLGNVTQAFNHVFNFHDICCWSAKMGLVRKTGFCFLC